MVQFKTSNLAAIDRNSAILSYNWLFITKNSLHKGPYMKFCHVFICNIAKKS